MVHSAVREGIADLRDRQPGVREDVEVDIRCVVILVRDPADKDPGLFDGLCHKALPVFAHAFRELCPDLSPLGAVGDTVPFAFQMTFIPGMGVDADRHHLAEGHEHLGDRTVFRHAAQEVVNIDIEPDIVVVFIGVGDLAADLGVIAHTLDRIGGTCRSFDRQELVMRAARLFIVDALVDTPLIGDALRIQGRHLDFKGCAIAGQNGKAVLIILRMGDELVVKKLDQLDREGSGGFVREVCGKEVGLSGGQLVLEPEVVIIPAVVIVGQFVMICVIQVSAGIVRSERHEPVCGGFFGNETEIGVISFVRDHGARLLAEDKLDRIDDNDKGDEFDSTVPVFHPAEHLGISRHIVQREGGVVPAFNGFAV